MVSLSLSLYVAPCRGTSTSKGSAEATAMSGPWVSNQELGLEVSALRKQTGPPPPLLAPVPPAPSSSDKSPLSCSHLPWTPPPVPRPQAEGKEEEHPERLRLLQVFAEAGSECVRVYKRGDGEPRVCERWFLNNGLSCGGEIEFNYPRALLHQLTPPLFPQVGDPNLSL